MQKTKYDADPATSHLTAERVARLEAVGFAWDARVAAWEEKLGELAAFKAMPGHGHCRVPLGYQASPQLGGWVSKQRVHKSKYDADPAASSLTAEQVAKLDALGFAWDARAGAWEEKLVELAAFKAMLGHCHVPARYPANRQLGAWVNKQRVQKSKYDADPAASQLTVERVAKLDALGFAWDAQAAAWEKKLAELAAFKAMPGHGHCNVPNQYPANKELGVWVSYQRVQKAKNVADPSASSLTAERAAKLDALGFAWSGR
jgi:REP element-mobilizing transposase RayT